MATTSFLRNLLLVFTLLTALALILLNDLVELQSIQTLPLLPSSFQSLPAFVSAPSADQVKMETRPDGSVVIKADFEAPRILEEDISIIIRTSDKPKCLYKLLAGIRQQYYTMKVIIADDGLLDSSGAAESLKSNVFYFRMPFDSGISAAKNLMLSQVQTKYVILLNDGMQWNQKIIGHFIQAMQIHPHLDLIGGNYRPTGDGDFSGLFHFENETLFIVKGNRGILEGTALPVLTPRDPQINYPEPVFSDMGPPCTLVDFVPPFFLARTASLLKLLWDNNLKAGEHEEFFIRFNAGKFRAAYCTALKAENQNEKCVIKEETKIEEGRNEFQMINRAHSFTRKGLEGHNVSKLAYCLGDSFGSPSWDRVKSPLSDDSCLEVPLPYACPIGRAGPKCDRCAPGFTGQTCSSCLPNHFGPHCLSCHCVHGSCELHEDGNSNNDDFHHPWCLCESGWFGPSCDVSLELGSNLLVSDKDFVSFKKPSNPHGEQTWQVYKDGCVRWADNGIWLMNDGLKLCGSFFKLELNQGEPLAIVVSAQSKGVGIAPFKNPAAYSVIVDLLYVDGSEKKDQILSFPEGTHALQFKEMVLPASHPVKTISIYAVLQVAGNAFFKSISVRQQTK